MKHTAILLAAALALTGCTQTSTSTNSASTADEPTTLTLYTYDNLSADYGLLPLVTEQFEQDNNVELEIVSFADTGSMINQLILEKDAPKADVVMGIDNIDFRTAQAEQLLAPYTPARADEIDSNLLFDTEYTLTPFDYGYVGFVYDTEEISFPQSGVSLTDLTTDTYQDQIILEQPGLSSPGTQLLAWSYLALGEDGAQQFWTDMEQRVLTVTPDWSTAYYSLFLEGEAPVVLSYLTSPAYHIHAEETDRYQAVPITDGYLRQVEGIGVVNGTDNTDLAQEMIDYILTDEVQNHISTTQWIYPVFGNTELPEAYAQGIIPNETNTIVASSEDLADFDQWLTDWNITFGIE